MENYNQEVDNTGEEEKARLFEEAQIYNEYLLSSNSFLAEEVNDAYWDLLKLNETDPMGFLEIPRLDVILPFYHGTDESVLQSAIGHLENTSLPIGGESTHAVFSGHRGLPDTTLFTDLDKMEIGDQFYITVLGETLAYEVDQILTVEPDEVEALMVVEGEDYVTLLTCTPYGINTHRLLVRGTRIPYEEEAELMFQESSNWLSGIGRQDLYILIAVSVIITFYIILLIIWLVKKRKKCKKG